jgi:protein ImuA
MSVPTSITRQRAVFDQLRREIGVGMPVEREEIGTSFLPLTPGSAHEIRSAGASHRGAATGFALALAALRRGRLLWCLGRRMAGEVGAPYGPGLSALGLDPDRVMVLVLDRLVETLIGAEEALSCQGFGTVLVETEGDPSGLDITAARRLKLRAAASGVDLLMLRHAAEGDGLPLDCRWRVAASPWPAGSRALMGPPGFAVALEKNRFGRTGHFDLVWSSHDQRLTPARRVPVDPVRAPAPRPASQAGEGGSLALAG